MIIIIIIVVIIIIFHAGVFVLVRSARAAISE
jgi:F0F1-type ATP synthase assembly protein I